MRDKRRSERVVFDRAVWILTKDLPIEAQAADVSRTGVRMQFPVARLGDGPLGSLAQIAAHLQRLLGHTCCVHMECVADGHSVRRDVRLVRIVTDGLTEHVQLGGAFDQALDDAEVTSLGITLPPEPAAEQADSADAEGSNTDAEEADQTPYEAMWQAVLPFEGLGEDEAPSASTVGEVDTSTWEWRRPRSHRQRWRVFLTGDGPARGATQRGQLHGVNTRALCMNLPRASLWDQALLDGDATTIALAITRRLGDEVSVKLTDGPKHAWSGRARVHGVELPLQEGAGLLVTLTFVRPMPSAELSRMGFA